MLFQIRRKGLLAQKYCIMVLKAFACMWLSVVLVYQLLWQYAQKGYGIGSSCSVLLDQWHFCSAAIKYLADSAQCTQGMCSVEL